MLKKLLMVLKYQRKYYLSYFCLDKNILYKRTMTVDSHKSDVVSMTFLMNHLLKSDIWLVCFREPIQLVCYLCCHGYLCFI